MTAAAERVTAIVVDYHAGALLADCVDSLRAESVRDVVVVDNVPEGAARAALGTRDVRVVESGVNLGYGSGVNRGAALVGDAEFLLVANPDVIVHPGAIAAMVELLDREPDVGIVGPTILTPSGEPYPSVRVFPSVLLAALHAIAGPLWPANPWTARYRSAGADGRVDWVSGAIFLIRRELFERLGGFDERYFMFAEEMDLCWRAGRAGARVAWCERAVATHVEGASRARAPRAMLIAHHRSALRFEAQTARGVRRALVPVAAALLLARLGLQLVADRRAGS